MDHRFLSTAETKHSDTTLTDARLRLQRTLLIT